MLFSGSGEVREALDPCYHQPCDTFENVADEALRQTAEAVVHVLTVLLGLPVAA